MKVDRKLNLVIPVERPDGPIYIHSVPISRAVYERHYLILAKTFALIWDEGLRTLSGPSVAAMVLRDVAKGRNVWDGPEGVEAGLMAEIRRLSNVSLPGPKGWESIPLQEAIDTDKLDEDEIAEVEGEIVFFTLECCLRQRARLPIFLQVMTQTWRLGLTSLDATEYNNSLPTLKPEENTGETVKASSIPR